MTTPNRNFEAEHSWLVECSAPPLIDAVRAITQPAASAKASSKGAGGAPLSPSSRPPVYEVPPPAFHAILKQKQ